MCIILYEADSLISHHNKYSTIRKDKNLYRYKIASFPYMLFYSKINEAQVKKVKVSTFSLQILAR